MPWGAIAGAVVGGLISSDGAKSAAGTQAAAARDATAAQERMFNRQVELQQPFRDVGLKANNRLAYLLGLDTASASPQNRETLRSQLLPQFTKTTPGRPGYIDEYTLFHAGDSDITQIDESGLNAEIDRRIASASQPAPNDRDFGSLMRDFSMADFEADPGYEFRRTEGMRGVENSAAARGGLLSGAALKAIQRYGQDVASQEYGNAFQRFNANQTNRYNRLAGVVNTGQGATNQIQNAASQFGQQQGANIIGAGNAQAAGTVGSANAINSAIGQGTNLYQQNQLMDLIRNPRSNSTFNTDWTTGSGRYARFDSGNPLGDW